MFQLQERYSVLLAQICRSIIMFLTLEYYV